MRILDRGTSSIQDVMQARHPGIGAVHAMPARHAGVEAVHSKLANCTHRGVGQPTKQLELPHLSKPCLGAPALPPPLRRWCCSACCLSWWTCWWPAATWRSSCSPGPRWWWAAQVGCSASGVQGKWACRITKASACPSCGRTAPCLVVIYCCPFRPIVVLAAAVVTYIPMTFVVTEFRGKVRKQMNKLVSTRRA